MTRGIPAKHTSLPSHQNKAKITWQKIPRHDKRRTSPSYQTKMSAFLECQNFIKNNFKSQTTQQSNIFKKSIRRRPRPYLRAKRNLERKKTPEQKTSADNPLQYFSVILLRIQVLQNLYQDPSSPASRVRNG